MNPTVMTAIVASGVLCCTLGCVPRALLRHNDSNALMLHNDECNRDDVAMVTMQTLCHGNCNDDDVPATTMMLRHDDCNIDDVA